MKEPRSHVDYVVHSARLFAARAGPSINSSTVFVGLGNETVFTT
jgi:hypothetical protein